MKRETAIRNAMKVVDRIRRCNGVIGTPECNFEALRVKRVWLFGSTVKGAEFPNDVDLLMEYHPCGRQQSLGQAKLDKLCLKHNDYARPLQAEDVALQMLAGGMRMVHIHNFRIDNKMYDIDQTKLLIYPRNDLERL